jgi:prefoldin subunit 5
MKHDLEQLQSNVQHVTREQPRLREYIQGLQEELQTLRQQIKERQSALEAVINEQQTGQQIRDANLRIMRVIGRISLYLDTFEHVDKNASLRRDVEEAKRLVDHYEEQLNKDDQDEIMSSILSRLSHQMTHWAERLQLEYSDVPYRLNVNKLTVIADRPSRPVPMERMGGGENWLGCHLIVHLALHKHFIENYRPVPGFLFLDQPTQVYFPSEEGYLAAEGTLESMQESNADMDAVNRMFELLFDVCEKLAPNFQIIVTEHANLDNERFQDALVESPWHGNQALIPEDWTTDA